jgi:hypothetical protein
MAEKLTEAEAEFVSEMKLEDYPLGSPWHNFDPDFRQSDIGRLIRRGWFEKRSQNGYREYRWTPAGRLALNQTKGQSDG